jgi:hypothetical protein
MSLDNIADRLVQFSDVEYVRLQFKVFHSVVSDIRNVIRHDIYNYKLRKRPDGSHDKRGTIFIDYERTPNGTALYVEKLN